MPSNQGWTIPRGTNRLHYVLNEHTLCRRHVVTYWFRRRYPTLAQYTQSTINVGGGPRFEGGAGPLMCVDCIRRYQQLRRIFGIPVLRPEPLNIFVPR
jgi:hypothetical protein